ncbi:hypothetical protein [Candidatus Vallotia lariciata]|uniref:hypothetical protein n=1 Tax=Candidatus Vallotia laricis TaxID=2018052 RepID=UPI001D02AC19|nr:hypothetical protein [Candidatus Vallotia lariciata]
MSNFLLEGREVFYPTSDKLLQTADQIRSSLGDWPRVRHPMRICFIPPLFSIRNHDVIVMTDTRPSSADTACWVASGATGARCVGAYYCTIISRRYDLYIGSVAMRRLDFGIRLIYRLWLRAT